MNRVEFREATEAFVNWAGKFDCDADGHLAPNGPGALAALPIALNIPASGRSVRLVRTVPFVQLTRVYSWRAAGMTEGTFAETRTVIQRLTHAITVARNDAEALTACKCILRWGGDRRPTEGALPFLESQQDLLGYLHAVKASLALDTAVIPPAGTFPAVMAMNSMLTKVHAFMSADGLPIYDSRVAGAIASLVEAWRQEEGTAQAPLPNALAFPEVGGGGGRRSVRARYGEAARPPVLYYATGPRADSQAVVTARKWASAKVRLGWLLSELLAEPSPSGIRSLEASLFMAGHNCAGINLH